MHQRDGSIVLQLCVTLRIVPREVPPFYSRPRISFRAQTHPHVDSSVTNDDDRPFLQPKQVNKCQVLGKRGRRYVLCSCEIGGKDLTFSVVAVPQTSIEPSSCCLRAVFTVRNTPANDRKTGGVRYRRFRRRMGDRKHPSDIFVRCARVLCIVEAPYPSRNPVRRQYHTSTPHPRHPEIQSLGTLACRKSIPAPTPKAGGGIAEEKTNDSGIGTFPEEKTPAPGDDGDRGGEEKKVEGLRASSENLATSYHGGGIEEQESEEEDGSTGGLATPGHGDGHAEAKEAGPGTLGRS